MGPKYDIFIAYHGDDKTGSEQEARNIYLLLKELYGDKLNIYFHPITSPNTSYHDTPSAVMNSKYFLLVAKDTIPVDENGMLVQINKNKNLSDLYQEVDVFYNLVYIKNPNISKTLARVIRVGDLSESKAEDFYYNVFKNENYKYEEIISNFENSRFYKSWFSKCTFISEETNIIEEKPINKANLNKIEDGMYDNSDLLNLGFKVDYISNRHVLLDKLTVDKEKYGEAMSDDVEGDADTWKEMISDTADSSINLVINNEIVGYMDFIPVEPETFDELKTIPFTKDAVAFYSCGGDFDIYGSMFSLDMNYATGANYLKFFQWMINKILKWKEEDIFIHRIVFSIYNNSQAKALTQLGFIKVLDNQLKGMLFETTVEELLDNKFVKSKLIILNLDEINFVKYMNKNEVAIDECKKILISQHAKNGGLLEYENAVDESDIVICAEYKKTVLGYVGIRKYDILKNSIYIEQIAIKKGFERKGIGSLLLKNVIDIANKRNYDNIYANCKKINLASYSLFKSLGFVEYDMTVDEYLAIGFEKEVIDNNYALVYKNI